MSNKNIDASVVVDNIRGINKQVLRSLETEMTVLKHDHPSLKAPIDSCYQRMRQHVLNHVGDCVRNSEKELGIEKINVDSTRS
jgi:hypothetical protein